ERVADRDDPLADQHAVGVTQLHGRQVGRALDLDQRDVRLRVAADHLRLVLLAGGEPDEDLVGVLDDVVVRDDEALRVDDEPRAEAARLERAARVVEESLERPEVILELIVVVPATTTATARSTGTTGTSRHAGGAGAHAVRALRAALHLLGSGD